LRHGRRIVLGNRADSSSWISSHVHDVLRRPELKAIRFSSEQNGKDHQDSWVVHL
jgi:hypothetical protein